MVYRPHYYSRQQSMGSWLSPLAVIMVAALVIGAAAVWAYSSNKAHIVQPAGTMHNAKTVAAQTYSSPYITFKYKGSYQLVAYSVGSAGTEQTLSRDDTPYNKTLAVEVQPLLKNGLVADSGYNFRQLNSALYQGNQIVIDGGPATEWVRRDGTERTIYIPHRSLYAVISFSLSGTNDVAGLPGEEAALLQTFQWK